MKKKNAYTKYADYVPERRGFLRCKTWGDTDIPCLYGREPKNGCLYKPVFFTENGFEKVLVPIYSFARSRRWNIEHLSEAVRYQVIDPDNFFAYHAAELNRLFKRGYKTAMAEIACRTGFPRDYFYEPQIVAARSQYIRIWKKYRCVDNMNVRIARVKYSDAYNHEPIRTDDELRKELEKIDRENEAIYIMLHEHSEVTPEPEEICE